MNDTERVCSCLNDFARNLNLEDIQVYQIFKVDEHDGYAVIDLTTARTLLRSENPEDIMDFLSLLREKRTVEKVEAKWKLQLVDGVWSLTHEAGIIFTCTNKHDVVKLHEILNSDRVCANFALSER